MYRFKGAGRGVEARKRKFDSLLLNLFVISYLIFTVNNFER